MDVKVGAYRVSSVFDSGNLASVTRLSSSNTQLFYVSMYMPAQLPRTGRGGWWGGRDLMAQARRLRRARARGFTLPCKVGQQAPSCA